MISTGSAINTIVVGSGLGNSSTVVNSALEIVSSGGVAIGATVSNTGALIVRAGGKASGTIVTGTNIGAPGSNGSLIVSAGGSAISSLLLSGGITDVKSGGVEIATIMSAGAETAPPFWWHRAQFHDHRQRRVGPRRPEPGGRYRERHDADRQRRAGRVIGRVGDQHARPQHESRVAR